MTLEQAIKDAVEKKCEVCGITIPRDPKLSSRQWIRKRFCSFKCGGKALSVRMPEPWNKGKKCPQLGGANQHLWKGGITPQDELIRKSREYKLWREAVFKRDDFTCQGCGLRGVQLQADHIKPFAWFPELRFAIDNGRTLCVPCHRKTPTFGEKSKDFFKTLV